MRSVPGEEGEGRGAARKDVEMPDRIPVKIRPLSGDAFCPYGQVLERGALVYPETDDGRVAMELLRVRRRPQPHQIAQLAIHYFV